MRACLKTIIPNFALTKSATALPHLPGSLFHPLFSPIGNRGDPPTPPWESSSPCPLLTDSTQIWLDTRSSPLALISWRMFGSPRKVVLVLDDLESLTATPAPLSQGVISYIIGDSPPAYSIVNKKSRRSLVIGGLCRREKVGVFVIELDRRLLQNGKRHQTKKSAVFKPHRTGISLSPHQ